MSGFELSNLGQIAILGAALSYSFAGVWGKRHLSQFSATTNAFGMLLGACMIMVPVVLLSDGVPRMDLSAHVWVSLLALAVMSTALAYLMYFKILKRAGSANLMLVTLLIPPVAVTLSYVFLGERLGATAGFGFLLIAIGLLITDGRIWARIRPGAKAGPRARF